MLALSSQHLGRKVVGVDNHAIPVVDENGAGHVVDLPVDDVKDSRIRERGLL
jgi:hypothetical protein